MSGRLNDYVAEGCADGYTSPKCPVSAVDFAMTNLNREIPWYIKVQKQTLRYDLKILWRLHLYFWGIVDCVKLIWENLLSTTKLSTKTCYIEFV